MGKPSLQTSRGGNLNGGLGKSICGQIDFVSSILTPPQYNWLFMGLTVALYSAAVSKTPVKKFHVSEFEVHN